MILSALILFETIALTGATVHTLEPGAAPAVLTIVIENDRISAVGPDVVIPEGAKRIDLTGFHVVPGLVDALVNHDPDHDRLYVGAGVTCVSDLGGELVRALAERERDARERSPGPALWTAGAPLEGIPPSTTSALVIANATDAEERVKQLLTLDAPIDWFHVQPTLARDARKKVIELAHKAEKQVWGPIPKDMSIDDVIAMHQDGLFHLDALLPVGKSWQTVTFKELEPAIAQVCASKIAIVPTLAIYARALLAPKDEAGQLDLLGPYYVQTWQADLDMRKKIVTEDYLKKGVPALKLQGDVLLALQKGGARIVPGTGSPYPWMLPGPALLDELMMWKRAGIPPEAVLRAATQGACEILGLKTRGTILPGKIADLVITKGDPSADLTALHEPAKVVLRGRVLDRVELDKLQTDLAERQRKIREEYAKPLEVKEPQMLTADGKPETLSGDMVMHGHVETRAVGLRLSGERFAVLRDYDGSLTYVGRMLTPGQASLPSTETWIRQRIKDGNLTDFDIRILSGMHETTIHGDVVGGKTNIQRRQDGGFVDTNSTADKIALVDVDSVTSLLILGYHRKPGTFHALFLDSFFEPAVGKWELALDTDGVTHILKTHNGALIARFDEHGAVTESRRESGNGIAQTKMLELKIDDGKGLPMPADKKALKGTGPAKPPVKSPAPVDGKPVDASKPK